MRVSFYTRAIRPALFALDAEHAHNITLAALRRPIVVNTLRRRADSSLEQQLSEQVFGLEFRNPVGLAAGLDKQGTAVAAWSATLLTAPLGRVAYVSASTSAETRTHRTIAQPTITFTPSTHCIRLPTTSRSM